MMTESSGGDRRAAAARTAKTKPAEVALVCAKCARRQGLRPRAVCGLLKRAAKAAAKEAGAKNAVGEKAGAERRRLRVVESGCLGPCPKRALAVATGASLAAGRVALLDPAAGPREALAAVLGAGERRGTEAAVPARSPASPDFGPNGDLAAKHLDESPASVRSTRPTRKRDPEPVPERPRRHPARRT